MRVTERGWVHLLHHVPDGSIEVGHIVLSIRERTPRVVPMYCIAAKLKFQSLVSTTDIEASVLPPMLSSLLEVKTNTQLGEPPSIRKQSYHLDLSEL